MSIHFGITVPEEQLEHSKLAEHNSKNKKTKKTLVLKIRPDHCYSTHKKTKSWLCELYNNIHLSNK